MSLKLVGILLAITFVLFFPYFAQGKTPFQANFMVTFFSPWNTEKFPGWEHGVPNKPIGLDNLNLFYPYKELSIDLLKQGIMPLWNPYNFSGNILMANFQSAIFYPLNLIYFVLPMVDAWSIMVLIQPILAGIFTYLFLSCFPIRKSAAIFGAVTFGFCGAMIVWMGDHLVASHTMLWLPLILYGVERRLWLLGLFTASCAIFAGFAQPLVYVFGVVIAYSLYRKINSLPMILFAIGIGAIQLLPSLEAFMISPRSTADVGYLYDQFLVPLTHLISFLAPDYLGNPATYNYLGGGYHESMVYVGVVPLLLALLARKNKIVTFFWAIALASLLLGLNLPPVRWFYELGIPFVSTFVPSRIFFVTSFALSVLAAFGFEELIAKKSFKRLAILSVVCLLVLGVWYLVGAKGPVMQRNLLLPAIFLGLTSILALTKRYLVFGVFALTILGQLYFGQKYLSFSERQFVYPEHPVFMFLRENAGYNRFWTHGDGYINANFATQYRVYSPDGTDAVFPSYLGELFFATETEGRLVASARIDARIARAAQDERLSQNPYRLRLLSIVGVKYITNWDGDGWNIYEYDDPLPRTFLTGEIVVETNPQKILDAIFRSTGKTTVLEEHVDVDVQATGSASIREYLPNSVSIDVDTQNNALLYLSDTYYPGWRAYVDGKESKIYKANYAFRGVLVPANTQKVEFRYEPDSFRWGAIISIVSLFIGILLVRRSKLYER